MPETMFVTQNLLSGAGFPKQLNLSLHTSRSGFSDKVKAAALGLGNSQAFDAEHSLGRSFVGLAILLGHEDGLLEALAIALADGRVFALCRSPHKLVKAPFTSTTQDLTTTNAPSAGTGGSSSSGGMDLGDRIKPFAFGAARIAMHIRYSLNREMPVLEMDDVESFDDRLFSKEERTPSRLVKRLLDSNVSAPDIDELWDKSPLSQRDDTSRFHDLALRAWLTAR